MDESPEGWYTDPCARHEARWMSQGTRTAMVRDGEVESNDPPPDEPFKVTPVRVGGDADPSEGTDLRRVDDAEQSDADGSTRAARGAWDTFDEKRPLTWADDGRW